MKFKTLIITSIAFLTLLFVALPARAQDDENWHYAIAAYVWGSGIDGKVGVDDIQVEIDQSFSDILEEAAQGFIVHSLREV